MFLMTMNMRVFLKSIIEYGIEEFVMVSVSYYRPGIKSYIK